MDPQRQRVQDDLRGLVEGDVRCDEIFTSLYASDASIYQIKPLGVVRPRSTADVVACVQYASENYIPLHARGAGTGLAGESIGPGLVIDFSCHMRRILHTAQDSVQVEPGVVLDRLNAHLRPLGRHFGPDPATRNVTTMGGVLGVDAAGSHWLKYGSARDHAHDLKVVLAGGQVLSLGREPLVNGRSRDTHELKRDLINRVVELLQAHRELIEQHRPRSLVNRCGYHLDGILNNDHVEMAKLLVGSEGTLALVTEATLGTSSLPRRTGMLLLLFEHLDAAARAVPEILEFGPAACDLLDRRNLTLARESDVRYDLLIPQATEAVLLVEVEGPDQADAQDRLRRMVERVCHRQQLAFGARQTVDPEEFPLYWQLARRFVPTLHRLKGSERPLPFVEDMAVPVEQLPSFLVSIQNVLKRFQVTASLFAHAGHGQVHLRPFLDLGNPDDIAKLEPLAEQLYEVVLQTGGTISGEHGDGLSRSWFIRRQYGPLYEVFRQIKLIFDPHNLLNPGKVVAEEPQRLARNLRPVAYPALETSVEGGQTATLAPTDPVPLQLHWEPAEVTQAARNCNGCGACRSQESDVRMCPIFRFAPAEEASPRAKANLLRAVLTGQAPADSLKRDEFKNVADLCVHCHMCRLECPANVDIPKLMLESKGAYVSSNGLRFSDWALSRIDTLSSLGSSFSSVANWAVGNRYARWLLEKTIGLAQGRKLPRFAARNFIRRAARRRLTRPTRRTGRKVLYFVDTYANYHDPQLGEALVAVLEHNGIAVYVHPDQRPAGMPLVAVGALEAARRMARANVGMLAEAVRQGYHIVATEPSAALCLTHEYPILLDDDDARLVAQHTSDACAYIWQLHTSGTLRLDFKPINAEIGYHQPCHLRALGVGAPGENLLRLIPGLSVRRIEKGCSGMAGTYGLKRLNYRRSLRAGWPLIAAVRESSWQAGATECCTCKIQMEQGTSKPTIHPLKLIALAYGMMPDAAKLLTTRGEELIVT